MPAHRKTLDFGQLDQDIFARAIEITSATERHEYLNAACGTDHDLRQRLDQWLAAHDQPDAMFNEPDDALRSILGKDAANPECFGEFEIIREIGRGGMGIVYEARQTSLNRRVALKVLSVGLAFSEQGIQRFQREAEAAAKLHHTNIVPIYTTGFQNQIPYYAMELVQGPSLNHVLQQIRGDSAATPANENEHSSEATRTTVDAAAEGTKGSSSFGSGGDYFDNVARAIADVADGLNHAHAHGVVHRDIKPSNLLLSPEGRVIINDFGLARVLEEPGLTMTGELMGSPRYMSPEQISPSFGQLDQRTDIYSLGVTLYEFMTRRPAFEGNDRKQILNRVLYEEPKPPRRLDPAIPLDLETICRKAMEKDADQRYQSADALAEDLRSFVSRHQISARRIGPLGRGIRWCRRNKSVAALSLLLMLSIMVGVTAVLGQRARREARFRSAISAIELFLPKREMESLERIIRLREEYGNREEIQRLYERIGQPVHVESDPSATPIYVRSVENQRGNWLGLGTTPFTCRLPKGYFHVKTIAAGGEDHILVRSNHDGDPWKILLPSQNGMVRVAAYNDTKTRIPWLRQRRLPKLSEFMIDRYEVTNAEFKQFVDARGYHNAAYWEDILGDDWEKTVDRFRDRQGERRGPRFWVDGTYYRGEDEMPVVGVSWYEAMAYAKWAGKQLPTLFHWLRASDFNGSYDPIYVSARSNIGRRDGTARANRSAHAYLSVATCGAFDLAGNVREWCLNAEGKSTRYAMGGSWNDNEDCLHQPHSLSALERSANVGFRCAIIETRPDLVEAVPIQWRSFERVRNTLPPIEECREHFVYDASLPWNTQKEGSIEIEGVSYQRFTFDTANGRGDRMVCYVALPDDRFKPPYQTIIMGHHLHNDPTTGLPNLLSDKVERLLSRGRAVVIPVTFGTGDRVHPEYPTKSPVPEKVDAFGQAIVWVVKDYCRTVDFVENYEQATEEPNIFDSEQIAYCGLGWAGCLGPIWIVADELVTGRQRYKAAVLQKAGLVQCLQPPHVDQLNYVSRLSIPTLMLTCKRSVWAPYRIAQKPMYDLLPLEHDIEKKLIAFPQHIGKFPTDEFDLHANHWLDEWLQRP